MTKHLFLFLFVVFGGSAIAGETVTISRASVVVRSGPAAYYDMVGVLKMGSSVEILEKKSRWAKILIPDNPEGWIPKNAFAKAESDVGNRSAVSASSIMTSPAGLAAAAKGFASQFNPDTDARQIVSLQDWAISPAELNSFVQSMQNRYEERSFKLDLEQYVNPPFPELGEAGLGLAIATKLAGIYGIKSKPRKTGQLSKLANFLARKTLRYDIQYKVFILDSFDVDAWGLPDGYIMVTKGLLSVCDNQHEVAAVLAHEIAHISAYHNLLELDARKVYVKADNAFAELDKHAPPPDIVNDMNAIANSAYTRIHKDRLEKYEFDADKLAAAYLYRSGLKPIALVRLLRKIKKNADGEKVYSGHPKISTRIEALMEFIEDNDLR